MNSNWLTFPSKLKCTRTPARNSRVPLIAPDLENSTKKYFLFYMGIVKFWHFDGKNSYWGSRNMVTQHPSEPFRMYFYNHFKFGTNVEKGWPEHNRSVMSFCHSGDSVRGACHALDIPSKVAISFQCVTEPLPRFPRYKIGGWTSWVGTGDLGIIFHAW